MDRARREDLRRRYLSLGWGEWLAACVFAYVAAFSLADTFVALDAQAAIWWALAPLLIVLVQAGTYWLCARTWVGVATMPRGLAATYRAFVVLDAVIIAAALVGIAMVWPDTVGGQVFALAAWLFAVAEYVNYFVIRLAYRPTVWWQGVRSKRTPRLMIDVREARCPISSNHATALGSDDTVT